ncbi:MAG: hypothetical protein LBQ45_01240 [Mycoplasmataceae bacterium]|jgi:hypothetical protein|nr:hypothetical protein [Mycoplasmataceae bacterium]
MTLRELNKKVDKIETTVSELAKIVTEFIVRQEQFNEEQRQFNAYVLDVFKRNNLK